MSEHRVDVLTFVGISKTSFHDAARIAHDKLNDWYQGQEVLFVADSSSVFQFSATATYGQEGTYFYIITVFDTRPVALAH